MVEEWNGLQLVAYCCYYYYYCTSLFYGTQISKSEKLKVKVTAKHFVCPLVTTTNTHLCPKSRTCAAVPNSLPFRPRLLVAFVSKTKRLLTCRHCSVRQQLTGLNATVLPVIAQHQDSNFSLS
jgi:hypothetical protein